MVDQINNGEEGYSVREKLNTVIDRTNTLNGIENQVETNKQNIAKNANQINNLWEHVDDIEDQIQDLDVAVLDSKIDKEIQDRIDGDQSLQDQIDAIDPDGDSSIEWSDIENKPSEFPPSAHGHEIGDVDGLQDALDAAVSDIPPWDYEFTPNTLVLRNDKGDIKGKKVIGQQLQMTTGGSSPPARPDDTIFYSSTTNQLYKNTAEGMRDALDVYSKSEVDELAPSSTLEGTWDYNPASATDGFFTTRNDNWLTATTITLHKFDSTGFEHNFALMNDGDIIYLQTPVGGAEYKVVSKTVNGNTCDFVVDAISYYGPFPVDGESTKINFIPQVSAGSGAGMVISESEPADKVEGMQWLNPSNGLVLFWDGEKWLQMPTTGAAGKDGVDGLWTDEGSNTISYSGTVLMSQPDAGADALAIGAQAGETTQSANAVALGNAAGNGSQGEFATAVGTQSGQISQGDKSTAVGFLAGYDTQGPSAVAIGRDSGYSNQDQRSVAVGAYSGKESQGGFSVAVGDSAGRDNQNSFATAVGHLAGKTSQGTNATAIGYNAGLTTQGNDSVAVGRSAGHTNQGDYSIAIGREAGKTDQHANSIIISATGLPSDLSYAGVSIEVPNGYLNYNGSDTWEFAGGNVTGGGLSFNSIVQDGSPVIDARGLITTLSTLRNATKDETTLEGMRDALADAIGGLIENLEHEIATMPAGDES